jgi:hypothetical protein
LQSLVGEQETRFAAYQHPVLVVVAPTVDAQSKRELYQWLDGFLYALPYYLVLSVSEVACHLFEQPTCVCITPSDVGIAVSAVVDGRQLTTVRFQRFEESLVSFPCPEINEGREAAHGRLLARLTEDEELVRFVRRSVSELCTLAKVSLLRHCEFPGHFLC